MPKSRRQSLLMATACTVAWGASPTIAALAQTAATAPPTTASGSSAALVPANQPPRAKGRARNKSQGTTAARQGAAPVGQDAARGATAEGGMGGGTTPAGTNAGANFGATPGGATSSGNAATDALQAGTTVNIDTVQKTYRELLLKEKNVASAVSEVGQAEIQSTGQLGSVQSLLKQTPSVNSYQSGVGQNTPELTVRGVRYSELSTTLNGIPINDLLSGGQGGYLSNNIGNPVSVGQLSSVNVYPGTAPVDVQGFGTNGGTVAYQTLKPTPKPFVEVTGGVGSFDFNEYGITVNTGAIPGTDGLLALLRYDRQENSGFIQNTQSRYRDFSASFDKPYNDGTSHVTLDVLYNTGQGYLPSAPVALDQIAAYGFFYNLPHNESTFRQDNTFLTAILGDETYINEHLILSGKLFYVGKDDKTQSYVNPNIVNQAYPYQPNFHVPFYALGPVGPTAYNTNFAFTGGSSPYYKPGVFTYDPLVNAPAGSDPTNVDSYKYGEAAQISYSTTNTYGITPKANIFLPYNNITIGGLFTKEEQPSVGSYVGANLDMAQINGYNSLVYPAGGANRTVYQGYAQDRIDLIHNTLHLEPGAAWEGVLTTNDVPFPTRQGVTMRHGYMLQNYDKAFEPYLGGSYDLPYHSVLYASYGRSASFPQITNYTLGSSGSTAAPHSTLLHAYEAGIRYDTPRLYLNLDYFYQKTTSAVGFYANYLTSQFFYSNTGQNQYRGVEASAQYRVTPALQVFGNGSYNDAQYLNNYAATTTPFNDQFGYGFKDTHLSTVPSWLFNVGASYEKGPISLRLWDQYTGPQYTTYNLSADPNVQPNGQLQGATVTSPGYRLPEFNTVNFLGSYTLPINQGYGLKSLKFTVNAQNIFNMHYFAYRYLSNFSYAGVYSDAHYYTSALQGPPASVIFNVTARF